MDFVHDAAQGGRKLKMLTLIDCHTRECLAIGVDRSIGGQRVTRVLDAVAAGRGFPGQIRADKTALSSRGTLWKFGRMSGA